MPASISIIGGGIIGLSCAWEMAQRGASVNVYDKGDYGRGASWAAAGMLAPSYEAAIGHGTAHPRFHELCQQSVQAWPGFAADLQLASGLDTGFMPGPSLAIATDADQVTHLAVLQAVLDRNGTPCQKLTPDEARRLEPALTGTIETALALPSDGQVDNRIVLEALLVACKAAGVGFGAPTEACDATLYATGWEAPNCRPVKGQLLSLERVTGVPQRLIQCGNLYIVPKQDRIVVGATSEPGASDTVSDIGATNALHMRAAALLPVLKDAPVLERWAGVRPMTSDGAPLLGQMENGNWIAAGHYRNGILLAPITAQLMADMILEGRGSTLAAAFNPQRFVDAASALT